MLDCRAFRGTGCRGGDEDVLWPVFFVTDMAFHLECGECGSDGRVSGRIRKSFQDVGHRGAAGLIEDIHNLAFPAGQMNMPGFHNAGNLAARCFAVKLKMLAFQHLFQFVSGIPKVPVRIRH
jgi:hypothetical protein